MSGWGFFSNICKAERKLSSKPDYNFMGCMQNAPYRLIYEDEIEIGGLENLKPSARGTTQVEN